MVENFECQEVVDLAKFKFLDRTGEARIGAWNNRGIDDALRVGLHNKEAAYAAQDRYGFRAYKEANGILVVQLTYEGALRDEVRFEPGTFEELSRVPTLAEILDLNW